ncbi:MAG: outer membrane lipoprotein carrier protein LolA [Planctomycetota bacterium]
MAVAAFLVLVNAVGAGENEPAQPLDAYPGKCLSQPPAEGARTLSDAEVDARLTDLFNRYKELKCIAADVVQTKTGGPFRRPVQKSGTLKVRMPDRLLLDMSADGLRILCDGRHAWIEDTDLGDVERWDMKALDAEGGKDFHAAGALFRVDAQSPEELRKEYRIVGLQQEGGVVFILTPIPATVRPPLSEIRITLPDGSVVPSEVRTTQSVEGPSERPPSVTTLALSSVQTNLEGLPSFPEDLFVFPLQEGIEVRDMSAPGGLKPLSYEELIRERREPQKGTETEMP